MHIQLIRQNGYRCVLKFIYYIAFLVLLACALPACTSGENTALSRDVADTSPPGAPGTPTDAGIYSALSTITFNWSAAADNESGISNYNLQIGTSPGTDDVFSNEVGNVLSYEFIGANGQTLYARVQAINGEALAGNWSGDSDGITIDTAAPATIINSPADGSTLSGTVNITADASDNVALDRVEFSLDAGTSLASISSGASVRKPATCILSRIRFPEIMLA